MWGDIFPMQYNLMLNVIDMALLRDFVGHGLGKNMHEDPQVPNYGTKGKVRT